MKLSESMILSCFATCFLLFTSCDKEKLITKDFKWKNGAKAVICLTYDDGMKSHYDRAIPHLDQFDLKGTFFINSIPERGAMLEWKKASQNGHELGNHTIFHPCPLSFGWAKEVATDHYTVDQILNEIRTVNFMLEGVDPVTMPRTFAYPCNNSSVGGASYINQLKESGLVSYARSGGEGKVIISKDELSTINPLHVDSWAVPEDTEYEELKSYVDQVIEEGGLGIFQFHGIGDQWIKVSNEDHLKLLQYLNDQGESIWVATFYDAMDYISKEGVAM